MSFLKREDIQLAEPFSERRLLNQGRYHTKWYPPYILQPKLNGERCRAIKSGLRCLLISSTGAIITTLPHINRAILHLPDGEYDGELYVHGWTFSEIHSVVSSYVTAHPKASQMQYHIFDLVNEGSQIERLTALAGILPDTLGPLHRVGIAIAPDLDGVMKFYDKVIDDGYEGFIIRQIDSLYLRKRSSLMMKFKPNKKDSYKIIGVNEAISESGSPKGMVGAFQCIDDMGTIFKVSAGKLDHAKRKRIWKLFMDDPKHVLSQHLEIEFQCYSDKGKVPHFSRAVNLINPALIKSTQQ